MNVRAKLFLGFVTFYVISGLAPGMVMGFVGLLSLGDDTAHLLVGLLTLATLLIMCLITGIYLRKWITRPIKKLIGGLEEMANGKLDVDLNINTGDEIESMAESLNRMKSSLKIAYDWLGPPELEKYKTTMEIKGFSIMSKITFGLVVVLISNPVIATLALFLSQGSMFISELVTFTFTIIMLIILVSHLNRLIMAPFTTLAEAAEKVSRGDFSAAIKVTQKGDIGRLQLNFKIISERVQRAIKELDVDD